MRLGPVCFKMPSVQDLFIPTEIMLKICTAIDVLVVIHCDFQGIIGKMLHTTIGPGKMLTLIVQFLLQDLLVLAQLKVYLIIVQFGQIKVI